MLEDVFETIQRLVDTCDEYTVELMYGLDASNKPNGTATLILRVNGGAQYVREGVQDGQ